MIKIENVDVTGWEHAIRGMRNPKNSWDRSDTSICVAEDSDKCDGCAAFRKNDGAFSFCTQPFIVGPNDHTLMMNLAHGGPVHAKYRRMIAVYLDITAPLYWWKEFDTYKVGTVANSCSTMHKIHAKEFTLDDFSCEDLFTSFEEPDTCTNIYISKEVGDIDNEVVVYPMDVLAYTIDVMNVCRERYLETRDKRYWKQMIQLLPTSYNQKRTVMLNYEVLTNMYESRKLHKLDEWRELCKWIESLPYSELIIGEKESIDET